MPSYYELEEICFISLSLSYKVNMIDLNLYEVPPHPIESLTKVRETHFWIFWLAFSAHVANCVELVMWKKQLNYTATLHWNFFCLPAHEGTKIVKEIPQTWCACNSVDLSVSRTRYSPWDEKKSKMISTN